MPASPWRGRRRLDRHRLERVAGPDISFPISTGGAGGTATHASIGVASSGASKILYSGALTPNIVVANGVTPIITSGSTISETDS
jgi:hypothetical protein